MFDRLRQSWFIYRVSDLYTDTYISNISFVKRNQARGRFINKKQASLERKPSLHPVWDSWNSLAKCEAVHCLELLPIVPYIMGGLFWKVRDNRLVVIFL